MIQLDAIYKSYKNKVIDDFSYTFLDNETVCLFGMSGCGKTTLLKLILNIEKPDSGKVIVHRIDKISCVFQEDRLLPWLSARENILEVNGDKKYCQYLLEILELEKDEDKYPKELSGGMKRRIALARALAYRGSVYLLDEPFKGIDMKLKYKVMQFVKEKMKEKLCIFVTHDIEEAVYLSDKIVVLKGIPLQIMDTIYVRENKEEVIQKVKNTLKV